MKKLLIVLLLFSAGVQAQWPDLSQFATKEDIKKVNKRLDSLNSSQGGSAVTPPIVTLTTCDKEPTVVEIFGITKTGASVRFDAKGVTNPALDLYTGAGAFISSTDYEAKSNVLILNYQLNAGEYQIKIRATNCKAPVSPAKTFKISETGEVVSPPADNTGRQGVLEYKVESKTFGVINARDSYATITPLGKVKITAPQTKQSFSGANAVKLMMFNSMMGQMSQDEIDQITTEGLDLPDGNYTWYLYWFNPKYGTDFKNVKANWWDAAGDVNTFRNNSGQFEVVTVDVRDSKYANAYELKPPSDIYGAAWIPDYQFKGYKINTDSPKKFGITKRMEGLAPEAILSQATHLQATYSDVNNIVDPNKTWSNLRAYQRTVISAPYSGTLVPGSSAVMDIPADVRKDDIIGIHSGGLSGFGNISVSFSIVENGLLRATITNNNSDVRSPSGTVYCQIFDSVEKQVNNLSYITQGHIVMSEMCENGIPFDKVEEIFKLSAKRFGTPANQQSYIADYFAGLNGWGTDLGTRVPSEIRQLMSNVDDAKREKVGSYVSYFYQNKAYLYRNRFANGYLTGVSELNNRSWFHIANLEKQFIAMPDSKVLVYGWTGFEGIGSEMERNGNWTRLPLPSGDILRLSIGEASFEQMKFEVLIARLLANYHVSWNDNGIFGKYAANFSLAYYGGPADWKTLFNPKGTGQYLTYNVDDPNQPKPDKSISKYDFNSSVAAGNNGSFAGALLYDQIADCTDKSIRWPVFNYTDNTGRHSGYFNGSNPVLGEKGAEFSRYGVSNPGQYNIANQSEYGKPIVIFCEGKAGVSIIVLQPNAGITEKINYQVTEGKTYSFTHTGPAVGIYRF